MTAPDDTPPEPKWFFRRIYAGVLTVLIAAGVALIIFKIDTPLDLRWIALALIVRGVLLDTLYIAGASFDWAQIVRVRFGKGGDNA
jgi:hypothetical protein